MITGRCFFGGVLATRDDVDIGGRRFERCHGYSGKTMRAVG